MKLILPTIGFLALYLLFVFVGMRHIEAKNTRQCEGRYVRGHCILSR